MSECTCAVRFPFADTIAHQAANDPGAHGQANTKTFCDAISSTKHRCAISRAIQTSKQHTIAVAVLQPESQPIHGADAYSEPSAHSEPIKRTEQRADAGTDCTSEPRSHAKSLGGAVVKSQFETYLCADACSQRCPVAQPFITAIQCTELETDADALKSADVGSNESPEQWSHSLSIDSADVSADFESFVRTKCFTFEDADSCSNQSIECSFSYTFITAIPLANGIDAGAYDSSDFRADAATHLQSDGSPFHFAIAAANGITECATDCTADSQTDCLAIACTNSVWSPFQESDGRYRAAHVFAV